MSGVIVFAMGFVIVVLVCLLSHNIAERQHWTREALLLQSECDDTRSSLARKYGECMGLQLVVDRLHRDIAGYQKMTAEIQNALIITKPLTEEDIPF